MTPFSPSATFPRSSRKESVAFRLCRVVECPQSARVERRWFRLTGPSADSRALRTYSIDSRVGFAPRFANMGLGAFTRPICRYVVHVFIHPLLSLRRPQGPWPGHRCSSVLRHTFVHMPGVGYVTERRIWRQAPTWDAYLAKEDKMRIPERLRIV